MDRVVGEVEEEGLGPRLADVVDRALGIKPHEVRLLGRADASDHGVALEEGERGLLVTDPGAVLGAARALGGRLRGGKRGAKIALHALGGGAHIVRVGQAEVLGEPLLQGKERELVAEVPLADAGRRVTGCAQDLGDCLLVRM